jgi:peptidylprolyl isomerase domain and WD repeat-containing protein 1
MKSSLLNFEFKSDTDLYEFTISETLPVSFSFSHDFEYFSCMGSDRFIRIFKFKTGKLYRKYNETLDQIQIVQKSRIEKYTLENIDFGRRLAFEKFITYSNVIFDESGNFILYPTLLGIKIINIKTNKVEYLLGKVENTERFIHLALFQEKIKVSKKNSAVSQDSRLFSYDPTLFALAFNKKRYLL